MGNIAYPALAIRPPEQPDLLGQAGKMMQLQNLGQAHQLQQLNMQAKQQEIDANARKIREGEVIRQAFVKNNGDIDQTIKDASQDRSVSPDTLQALQLHSLAVKQKVADASDAQLKLHATQVDNLRGAFKPVFDAPDEQKPILWQQQRAAVLKNPQAYGVGDPNQVPEQFPGKDAGQILMSSMVGQAKQLQEEQQRREIAVKETEAGAKKSEADTAAGKFAAEQPGIAARGQIAQQEAAMSPQQRGLAGNLFYGAAGGNKQAQRALGLETQQKIDAAKAATAGAPGAVSGIAPHLVGPATAAFTKAGEEYATAYQAAQNMSDFLAQAKSGNKEAVKIVPLQGALEITTAQGVHRINRTEVDQFGGAGNAYDKLAGAIGGAISGKNITDSVLNDMDKLQQVVSQNAKTLHSNKVSVINKSYGSKFEPMDFGGNQNQSRSGGPPTGATMKVPGSDGKMHWSDGKKDLGVIE